MQGRKAAGFNCAPEKSRIELPIEAEGEHFLCCFQFNAASAECNVCVSYRYISFHCIWQALLEYGTSICIATTIQSEKTMCTSVWHVPANTHTQQHTHVCRYICSYKDADTARRDTSYELHRVTVRSATWLC